MKQRYDYCGEKVPWWCATALYEGFRDRYRLPVFDRSNLYRRCAKRLLWRVGFWLAPANVLEDQKP